MSAAAAPASAPPTQPALEIVLRGDPTGSLNPNLRIDRWERARRVKDWRFRAWVAWTEAGRPTFDVPVSVRFIVRRGRVLDEDNTLAALAPVINGLRVDRRFEGRGGMIPDDAPTWLHIEGVEILASEQFRVNPTVTILVRPIQPLEASG